MDYRIVNTTEEFRSLKIEWEKLEQIAPEASFFSTFEYCFTWWEAYQNQPDYKLWIICILQNSECIGIAPLMIQKQKKRFLRFSSLLFLAPGDYKDFLIDIKSGVKPATFYKRIFAIIEENEDLWDEMHLTHISHKSPLAGYLLKSKYNPYFNYLIENPYINIAEYENFESFTSDNMPSKTIQYVNRLKKLTNYSLHITTENMIESFAYIHIAEKNHLQNEGKYERHSLFEDELRRSLFYELFSKGLISSYYLYDNVKNKILIYNFGYIFQNVFHSINTAFDPLYEKLGLGKVMYYEIFKENFINQNWKVLDSGTGRYQWKFEWTSKFNFLYQLYYVKPESKKLLKLIKLRRIKKAITK